MARTAPDINDESRASSGLHHQELPELTSAIGSRLPTFHRIALRQLNNVADAEDSVQDALLAAWTHARQFRGQAQLSTWLTSIVINSARMKLRGRQRRMRRQVTGPQDARDEASFLESFTDLRPGPEEVYRHRELLQLLNRSLRRLSPAMRRTLQLHSVEGMSNRETAHLLEVPVSTVKTQLARARRKLREMMLVPLGRQACESRGPREGRDVQDWRPAEQELARQ